MGLVLRLVAGTSLLVCADVKERMRDFENENPVSLFTNFNIHFFDRTFPSCLKREKLKI